jgi:hypothetical protein
MIQLETYKGTRTRHTCPACNSKNQFTRFVDDAGNYLADDVGICNRVSKCGYRYTAKQYYADNPQAKNGQFKKGKRKSVSNYHIANLQLETPSFDFIAPEHLHATLSHYDRNPFVQFLFDLFPDCIDEIQAVLQRYYIGTYKDGLTVFWQIDGRGRIHTGKIMRYDTRTGKRQIVRAWIEDGKTRQLKVDWMHGKIKKDFSLMQIFFGEHLLCSLKNTKPVAIVEAEKTAIVASLCFPEKLWLATGSKQWLKTERLQRLGTRQIVLYPDADGFDQWQQIATAAQRQGLTVKVSSLIENHATIEQKANGYDLADYLINQQREINELNEVYDAYNSKVDLVLNDETLFNGFKFFLEEQLAIAIYNGESEAVAERICTQAQNVRSVALSI